MLVVAATIEEAPPSHLPKSQIALCSSSSSSSVLPILKKIRIQRRDPSGIVENIGTPISLTPYVPPITATDGTTMSTEPIPDTYEVHFSSFAGFIFYYVLLFLLLMISCFVFSLLNQFRSV